MMTVFQPLTCYISAIYMHCIIVFTIVDILMVDHMILIASGHRRSYRGQVMARLLTGGVSVH